MSFGRRADAYYAALALEPGKGIATDARMPFNLAECLLETRKDIDESGTRHRRTCQRRQFHRHSLDPDDEDEMPSQAQ